MDKKDSRQNPEAFLNTNIDTIKHFPPGAETLPFLERYMGKVLSFEPEAQRKMIKSLVEKISSAEHTYIATPPNRCLRTAAAAWLLLDTHARDPGQAAQVLKGTTKFLTSDVPEHVKGPLIPIAETAIKSLPATEASFFANALAEAAKNEKNQAIKMAFVRLDKALQGKIEGKEKPALPNQRSAKIGGKTISAPSP